MEAVINLEDFRVKQGSKISVVFTGRDRGAEVRQRSNIDEIAKENDNVRIIIPDNIFSINPSFLEEFLVNVVQKYGKEKFLEKFSFESIGDYDVTSSLTEAIDRILNNESSLVK